MADFFTPSLKAVRLDAAVEEKHTETPVDELYAKCVATLQKSSADRTEDEIETLYKWLLGLKIHLVQEHSDVVVKEVCRHLKYEKVAAGTTVMRQGDVANKLYVIIKGTVGLYVVNDHTDTEYPDPVQHTIKNLQQMFNNSVSSPSIQKMQIGGTLGPNPVIRNRASLKIDTAKNLAAKEPLPSSLETPEQRRLRVQTNPASPKENRARMSLDNQAKPHEEIFVGFIRAGGPKTSFGELALISGGTRSATIRTDLQDCEFLTLDKEDFDRVLKGRFAILLEEKVKRMKQFRIFQNMSDIHLQKISLHLESKKFGPNQLISKEAVPATNLYFLLKGLCEVTKLVHEDNPEKDKRASLKVRPQANYVQHAVLEENSTFGTQEALSEPAKPYEFGLRSLTDCELWVIERGEFLRRARGDVVEEALSAPKKK